MKTLLVIVTEGMMDSSLGATLDILRTASLLVERHQPKQKFTVITAGHQKRTRTAGGLIAACDLTFKQIPNQLGRVDWVLIPGSGKKTPQELHDSLAGKEIQELISTLHWLSDRDAHISASCASAFILAEAGLLKGKSATTSWWLANVFRQRYPEVVLDESKMLVRDGRFLTAGAVFSQMDVVLEIVTEVAGASIAYLCSRYLLIEQRSSQARYMIPTQNHHLDPIVIAAEKWVDQHIAQAISVQELAAQFAISAKTLGRRIQHATGDSPIKFIQKRKVMRAVHLIESSTLPIESIAAQVGYQNSTTLRQLIKRELGVLPSGIR